MRAILWCAPMNLVAAILLGGVAVYAAAGIVIGLGFVMCGVSRVLPHSVTVTIGARILLFPGAAALWPVVLARWLKMRR